MKIEIDVVRNGLLVKIEHRPSANDPLAQRGQFAGTWHARDTTDALGRIAEAVKAEFDPVLDQLGQD